MKLWINTDDIHYASTWHYHRILKAMNVLSDRPFECVLNIASVQSKNLLQGTKCTLYIEGDDFTTQGANTSYYNTADLVYIYTPKYLKYYPPKVKIIQGYFDPAWHYPRPVPKDCDYIFVGKTGGDTVYDHRKELIEGFKNSKWSVVTANCSPEEYPNTLSRGRIILNVLPRRGSDASPNNRIMEGIACGCLMNDRDEVVDDLGLIPNVHYLPIERFGEDFSDEELLRIHQQGRSFILEKYSYQNAIRSLFKDIESVTGEKIC